MPTQARRAFCTWCFTRSGSRRSSPDSDRPGRSVGRPGRAGHRDGRHVRGRAGPGRAAAGRWDSDSELALACRPRPGPPGGHTGSGLGRPGSLRGRSGGRVTVDCGPGPGEGTLSESNGCHGCGENLRYPTRRFVPTLPGLHTDHHLHSRAVHATISYRHDHVTQGSLVSLL